MRLVPFTLSAISKIWALLPLLFTIIPRYRASADEKFV
jgi:hypothetical protein